MIDMPILNLNAVISHLGPLAVKQSLQEFARDNIAITAVRDQNSPDRVRNVCEWLRFYNVLQGLTGERREAVTSAVVTWADQRGQGSDLDTVDSVIEAHASLSAACSRADVKNRNFVSLASKALWLRYPTVVPLYDSFVQRVLWMISKVDGDPPAAPHDSTSYAAFALHWNNLYDRNRDAIAAIDAQGYPYGVRIFDRILWLLGEPSYGADTNRRIRMKALG
jgi:hypothetical protein